MCDTASVPGLSDLNEPQRAAVLHRDGPLLVLAGPGSGKTRVITQRAAQLVRTGVAPGSILAITFTNKAADEMRQRIHALGVGRGMWVYTFHALGVRLIREFGRLARVEPGFTIYDEADQTRLVKEAMQLCQIDERLVRVDDARQRISHAKNALQTPAEFAEQGEHFNERMLGRIYEAYEQLLEQRNAVDFDDLLMRVAVVLRDQPDITERLNIRFRYLLIDEYQDTNHAQYLIARYLSQHHRNICATGDPDQSIYAWRGADLSNILDFEHDYPEATVVRLEENYRSTQAILRVASKLISANRKRKHKDLWTRNAEGAAVDVWEFAEDRDEADHVATVIGKLHQEGRAYGQIAIAYRVNALSRGLEEALRHRGIPYRIARGVEFYNRREIRDTLAYLRVLVNPADQNALLRIINTPARGIGQTTVKRLLAHAQATGPPLIDVLRAVEAVPEVKTAAKRIRAFVGLLDDLARATSGASVSDAVSTVLTRSGLEAALADEEEQKGEDRLANVRELVSAAARYEEELPDPTLEDFLQRVSLTSDQDAIDETTDAVLLLTLHAAKGLEFPVVFIVGLEQGLLPHERAITLDGDIEEERRLTFVGITRAQERLFLTHARQRFIRGQRMPRPKSQFLGELPDDAVVHTAIGIPAWLDKSRDDGFAPDSPAPDDEWDAVDVAVEDQPGRGRLQRDRQPDPDEVVIDIHSRDADEVAGAAYADWQPGTLVQHAQYGVGQIQWIRPGAGQTRASIRFAGQGEKVFILELAPVSRLQR